MQSAKADIDEPRPPHRCNNVKGAWVEFGRPILGQKSHPWAPGFSLQTIARSEANNHNARYRALWLFASERAMVCNEKPGAQGCDFWPRIGRPNSTQAPFTLLQRCGGRGSSISAFALCIHDRCIPGNCRRCPLRPDSDRLLWRSEMALSAYESATWTLHAT